jgi:hypothetical protein
MPVKCAPNQQLEAEISPRDLVFKTCRTFAPSQGFYGRLLRDLERLEAENEDLAEFWEQFEDCKDVLDVVMKLEG